MIPRKYLLLMIVTVMTVFICATDYWDNPGEFTMPDYAFNNNFDGILASGDSLNCRLIGRPLFGGAGAAAGWDDYVAAAFGFSILFFDISDNTDPVRTSYIDIGFSPMDIVIRDSLAYVGLWSYGLQIYNINDPYNVQLVGSYYVPYKYVRDVLIYDTIAVLSNNNNSADILNISDPANPTHISTINTGTQTYEASISSDTILTLACYSSGIKIYNIADVSNPAAITTYDTPGSVRGVTVVDTIAYVSDFTNGLLVINIADPGVPDSIGWFDDPGAAYDIQFMDTIGLFTDDTGGMRILSVNDPTAVYEIGYYNDNSIIRHMSHNDSIVFALDLYEGLVILDITDPANPAFCSNHDEGDRVDEVDIVDTLLYATMGTEGFVILNASDPSNAFLINQYDSTGTTTDIKVQDGIAYIANSEIGLHVLDVSDPMNPITLGTCAFTGYPRSIDIYDDTLAYLATDTTGLTVVNISDPAAPFVAGTCNTRGNAYGCFVMDTLAFVADGDSNLCIISVADPAAMYEVGAYDPAGTGRSYNITAIDTFVFSADHVGGIRVYGISDPSNPNLLTTYNTDGYAYDVVVDWPELYLADDTTGVTIFNILNPADPKKLGYYNTFGQSMGLDFQDSIVVVADWTAGISILDYTQTETYTLTGTVGLQGDPADSSGTFVWSNDFAQSCSTNASGYYEFTSLFPDSYAIIYEHYGYKTDTLTGVFTGTEEFNITLDTLIFYTLTGTVGLLDNPADSSGTIVEIVELAKFDTTDASGNYSIDSVLAGSYTFVFSHPTYITDTISFGYTGVETVDNDLARITYTLSGIISLSDNPGDLSGTEVYLEEWSLTDSTDASGYYEFTSLLPDSYNLYITHDGYYGDTIPAVLIVSDTFNLELILKTYTLSGIIGLSDNPADSSGTEVYCDELSLTDSTDNTGYYEFNSVAPGTYNLYMTHDGYYPDSLEAVFTGAETFDLTLIFDVLGIVDNNYMNKPLIADMEAGNGKICFTYNKKTDAPAHLNIYDLTGRNLYKAEISSAGAYKVSTLSNLGRGIYFLVISEPENTHRQKIVLIK